MKLFLDACSIIYLIESHQQQGQNTRLLITQALQNKTQLVVSRLSFLECRVLLLKEKMMACWNVIISSFVNPVCKS